MNIHSFVFFGFAAAVLAVYYLSPRRMQNIVLLAASYIFYISISWDFGFILAGMTLINFFLGRRTGGEEHTRTWLYPAVRTNLAVLIVFKLAGSYVSGARDLFFHLGLDIQTHGLKIRLLIGLCF